MNKSNSLTRYSRSQFSYQRWKYIYFLLAILAGGIAYRGYAPYQENFPLYISLLVYVFLLNIRNHKKKASYLLPYLWDVSFNFTSLFWLTESVNYYGNLNYFFGLFLVFMVSLVLGLRSLFVAIIWNAFRRYFILLPVLFTLVSYIYLNLIVNFDWLNIGYSQIDDLARTLAPFGGVYLVEFFKFSFSVLVYMAIYYSLHSGRNTSYSLLSRKYQRKFRIAKYTDFLSFMCVVGLAGISSYFYPQFTVKDTKEIQVALVQPNIDAKAKWDAETVADQVELYRESLEQILSRRTIPQLVIFPESAIGADYRYIRKAYDMYTGMLLPYHTALLAGVVYDQNHSQFYNTAMLFNPKSEDTIDPNWLVQRYNKKNLVPFGEYLPLAGLLKNLHPFFTTLAKYGFIEGSSYQANLETADSKLAVGICFDVLFGSNMAREISSSTGAIVSISNDIWFGNTAGPHQHFNIARFRAIENQRYLVRDSNNGITAIVNSRGEIVSFVPRNKNTILYGSYYNHYGKTPYQQYPLLNLFLLSCFGVFLLFAYLFSSFLLRRVR